MSVTVEVDEHIAIVTIDNPPVNATSVNVRSGLLAALRQTEDNPDVSAVVLACAGTTFIAGADIREFGHTPVEPHLPDVIVTLESATKPWVAAMHGTVLGAGLEVALGCHYRMAVNSTLLGLPEVNLGLIPGGGATVRLPRLVPTEKALEMIASGKPVKAVDALNIGLIDEIAEGTLLETAIAFAKANSNQPMPTPISQRSAIQPVNQDAWQAQKTKVRNRARSASAPLAAIEAVENALTMSGRDALKAERALFLKLKDDPQSTALRHIFFAERSTTRMPRLKGIKPRSLQHIGIIGGGTMGAGIAAACLLAGISKITLIERDNDSLQAGRVRIEDTLSASEKRGLISQSARETMLNALHVSTDYSALNDATFVIEAVFEDMQVKMEVFKQLDQFTPPDTILASNTSYLDINELARATLYPARIIGLHFFSPAHIMKLLEIIVTEEASDEALATAFALGKKLRKVTVPSGVCDGFIGNRIMSAYRRECEYMLEDGAQPEQIDAAMTAFGFPMGIFAMQDLAGLDIAWAMRKRQAATRSANMRYVDIPDRLCKARRFGRKTGSGWYDYSDNKTGKVDSVVTKLILRESARKSIKRIGFTEAKIMTRILESMQAEGEKILAENIAETPEAIDVVMINGYGFPRWKGGPMFLNR
ncbi:MAG: 3-hydroxyacyl-CoA dehydrogenase NAD-binding domain-containing protein [Paracoccaceae bacterium]